MATASSCKQCALCIYLLHLLPPLLPHSGPEAPKNKPRAITVSRLSIAGRQLIGTCLGWGMCALYMGGRVPQLHKNWRRGSTEGVSAIMFIFAVAGNATYLASILVR